MGRGRLEAFSDGVLAIIITIMVLELKSPEGDGVWALLSLAPIFFSYVLSFVYVGIYWNNHHHLLQACRRVSSGVLWANLHLLFWLSLVPFATRWIGENHYAALPTAVYGLNLLLAAVAYWILQQAIIRNDGQNSLLRKAIGRDLKGRLSLLLYALAVLAAFAAAWLAQAIYVLVALIWIIPDRRIEQALLEE
ncbi:TMEM175 family protein [Synechococcus sp. BA-124 BA4]|uniref:TMEM175 family protein n=1 Tax=unclassified Synechococcus TaxID=2626047 RepID=UPI002AD2AAE7|nr:MULTISPECIES: TMEM175 family protein [unclassified Synechococcus]MEA5398768.1 TMEM175 family protein [Synechococcus sp. BA-124 BA4]CAK6694289.1 Potassium channel [Synechococcus sp. CBW1107]